MYGARPSSAEPPKQKRSGSLLPVSDLTNFWEQLYRSKSAPSSPVLIKFVSTPSPMLTRRTAKGKRSEDYAKTAHAATALLNNIAEASCQAIGFTKKKKNTEDNMSRKSEKEDSTGKPVTDEYYDDRLSRDSQLDDNLKSLVSSRPPSATFGHLSTDLDTVSGEDDDTQVEDEFYDGANDSDQGRNDNDPPPDDASGTLTAEEMGALMGDWNDTDIPSPSHGPQKRQATSSPGQDASDASLLSVDVPVRHDPKRIAMAERQVIKIVKAPPPRRR
jgi:hypothetical protein